MLAMTTRPMHADEVSTDSELVRRLLRGQFPHWADRTIERVASAGTDNAIFRLGGDLSVRLPRIHWAVDNVDVEFEWVPKLAPLVPLPIPVPIAKGAPAEGFPWSWTVCRWLEGQHPAMGAAVREADLATDLAGFISTLANVVLRDGPKAGRGIPLVERDKPTREALGKVGDLLDTARATEIWEAALAVPPWTGPPIWIHGDLSHLNMLCVDDRLSAILDFGGVGRGDPACGTVAAWNTLSPQGRAVFRNALDIDDATWDRSRGWALSIALIQLPYYRETNPALCEISYYVIDQILSEMG